MSNYNMKYVDDSNENYNEPKVTLSNIPPPGAQIPVVERLPPLPNCPIGLEYLAQIDKLEVNQIISILESFTGWETNNKYVASNSAGQQVYYIFEETDCCMRFCCGPARRFLLHVVDNSNQEVLRISREFKCCTGGCCCWCAGCCDACSQECKVETPTGEVIGYIKQKGSGWKAAFDILDENRETVLKIRGPCMIWNGACCPCVNEFHILNKDETADVALVCREYAGFWKEAFTNARRFSVTFPLDMAVKTKATLLGALFLIDFMFYEKQKNNNNN